MRLLCTLANEKDPKKFSDFLTRKEIENSLEVISNTDWGSDEYGTVKSNLWVIDEDQVQVAMEWLDIFLDNPDDPRFAEKTSIKKPTQIRTSATVKQKPLGIVTLYLIIGCAILLLLSIFTTRSENPPPKGLPLEPLYLSPVNKALYFDYPYAYTIVDKLVKSYGFEKMYELSQLPPDGQYLLQQYYSTPIWTGVYDKVVTHLKTGTAPTYFDTPIFEKVQQGEWWRLFTPCLLHADPIHLLFNMLWLLILGKQMEERLGISRYILFIVLTAIFSNTAQYLMSGSNFIGFSGVVCAMIAFIWFRQKRSPWEGYQLQTSTMGFITLFIFAMVGIQAISFFYEIQGETPIMPGIANTAHLAGALIGYLFSFSNFFQRKQT